MRISDPNLTYELKSPGYPARLPQNLECEWTLRAPEGSVIELDFLDVNFTSPTTSCSSTYLTLRYHDSRLTYRFCGNSPLRRKKFRVASSLLTIKLVTGRTQNIPPGFSLNWKIGKIFSIIFFDTRTLRSSESRTKYPPASLNFAMT